MEKTFMIPSVFEENSTVFSKVADNFVDGIRLVNFKGKDYIIGNLALKEGSAPHKLINSSPDDIDYQLLGLTAMLIASMGSYSKLVLTIGFPNTTYPLYKKDAAIFFQGHHLITFDGRTYGKNETERIEIQIDDLTVLTEVEGCCKSVKNTFKETEDFFIASLGFGTFELGLHTTAGIVNRTAYSTKGISYAVNLLENELNKEYYLNLLTEQQIERAFQRGSIVANRKRIDIAGIRARALQSYYSEVISPSIRKKFNDEDYVNTRKMYLAGGGAMYGELVELFKREFQDILEIIVYPEPYMCASKGYCLNSMEKIARLTEAEKDERVAYVGIDLGNSNTAIVVNVIG